MLTFVINGMTGLVAALVIASLIQSARAFPAAWKRLHAEVKRLEKGVEMRVTLRETTPADLVRLASPAPVFDTHKERPAVTPVLLTPQNRSAYRSTLRPAAA